MPYGWKKQLEMKAEREARKAERERLKKEKEEEKKKQKKAEHKKKLKSKQNKRAYAKRRKALLAERAKVGDENGYYSIYITKNYKKVRTIGKACLKSNAYRMYNEAIEANRANINFPKSLEGIGKDRKTDKDLKYEIVMIKKVGEGEETVASFRNEEGKFIENIIEGKESHVIVEKDDWYVEETFPIYGLHPQKQKKTYDYILNELILSKVTNPYDMRRIVKYNNKLIIQYLEDFDFLVCYNEKQCSDLYEKLESDITKKKIKYVVFMGSIVPQLVSDWIDRFEEKTGWTRSKTKKTARKL